MSVFILIFQLFKERQFIKVAKKDNKVVSLTIIIPRARMDSESTAHERGLRKAVRAIDSDAMRARGIIQLVGQKNIETNHLRKLES